MNYCKELLINELGINPRILKLVEEAEKTVKDQFQALDDITAYNQYKVLSVMQKHQIADRHFAWNTGYGYDDAGREAVENVYADVFGTETALVRPTIVN